MYSDEALVTLSGGEYELEFYHSHNFYHIQNLGTSAIKLSAAPNISGRDDGVIEIPSGGSATISSGKENKIYIYGSGRINVAATDSNINPFRNAAKGGGGGGSGVSSYRDLTDLPSINGHTLLGNKTAEELGITGGGSITVDDDLSEVSTNPVQNRVIRQYLIDYLRDAKGYTDAQIADLINGSETILETLQEIADAMKENEDVVKALDDAIGNKANKTDLEGHIRNYENPHRVTAEQLGLGNVDNTRDADKEVKSAGKLTNGVYINGVWFDGSESIDIPIGEGTEDYNDLNNKPSVNGFKLSGEVTQENLGWNELTEQDAVDMVNKAFDKVQPYTVLAEIPFNGSLDGWGYNVLETGDVFEENISEDGLYLTTYVKSGNHDSNFMIQVLDVDMNDYESVDIVFDIKCKTFTGSSSQYRHILQVMLNSLSPTTSYAWHITSGSDRFLIGFRHQNGSSAVWETGTGISVEENEWSTVKLTLFNKGLDAKLNIDGQEKEATLTLSDKAGMWIGGLYFGSSSYSSPSDAYIKNIKVAGKKRS